MASKKERIKLKPKQEINKYLNAYISWVGGMRSFRILNGDNYDIISERELRQNGKQCWFNLTNVKNEVNEYAKKLGLKTTGLGELFICIENDGFSYSDKDPRFDEVKQKAKERSITLID